MASLTIRNLDNETKKKLRLRAAVHGRSMEAEAREILSEAVNAPSATDLAQRIRERFAPDGAELPIPERQNVRTPPSLDE